MGAGTSAEEFFLKSINVESIFEFVERTDYLFLYSIKECVEKSDCHEGVYLSEVAEYMKLSIPETSKMVKSLENKGYIIWKLDEKKERTYLVLTNKAIELSNCQKEKMIEAYEKIISNIQEDDPEFMELDMDFLVRAVKEAGIQAISGKLVGDVSLMDSIYWGEGWSWDDTPEAFQPYLSPLMLNRGCVDIKISPSAKGKAGTVEITPESDYYQLNNRSISLHPEAGKLKITRDWLTNGNTIDVSGCVSSVRKRTLNLYDSKRFFMDTFCYKLNKEGLSVSKDSISFLTTPDTVQWIYTCRRPVEEVLKRALKESDNLSAEALFRQLGQMNGKHTSHISFGDCQVVIGRFMRNAIGYDPKEYRIVDGSGVSLYNYVSPRLILAYLNYAYRHPSVFQTFYDCLPVAGVDGTLQGRMRTGKAFRNVRAKTGTVTGISTLAGYLTSVNGHKISFVIINQNVLKARQARKLQDKICELLIQLD